MKTYLTLIPKEESKYLSPNTMVFEIKNCYKVSKLELFKTFCYFYPELKLKKKGIKVVRSGVKRLGKKIYPKTKVIYYLQKQK